MGKGEEREQSETMVLLYLEKRGSNISVVEERSSWISVF